MKENALSEYIFSELKMKQFRKDQQKGGKMGSKKGGKNEEGVEGRREQHLRIL